MLYRDMLARGHKANAATMAALMSTAVAAGQPEMALGMWEGLNNSGLRPSPACASARLEALIQLVRLIFFSCSSSVQTPKSFTQSKLFCWG